MVKCQICGEELVLPYKCKYCGGYFCVKHHLPENHNCPGLIRNKWRYEVEEERFITPPIRVRRIRKERIYFTEREIRDLLLSIFLVGMVYLSNFILRFSINIGVTLSILIGSISAFIFHELAHKFSAINYGFRAEYVTSRMGLLLTLISTIPFIPIKVITPGYVRIISYRYDKNIYGRIALAGPSTNILLALLFVLLSRILYYPLIIASLINIDIAFFNMLPFPILDGSHIIRWSINTWILVMIFTLFLWFIIHIFI